MLKIYGKNTASDYFLKPIKIKKQFRFNQKIMAAGRKYTVFKTSTTEIPKKVYT